MLRLLAPELALTGTPTQPRCAQGAARLTSALQGEVVARKQAPAEGVRQVKPTVSPRPA